MVPGDGLEFKTSGAFKDQVRKVPKVEHDAGEALRRNPNQGEVVAGPIKTIAFHSEGVEYVAFFRRIKNTFGLIVVFEAGNSKGIEEKKKEFLDRFAKGEFK